ncbi:BEN domain-containing protein 7 [Bombina bombina]|uniref:BEN domain-containing protein 7 n=1 Tax=Bombina bombina TaxID=8345 RepID=UPI00235B0506|nr:BEN domain-containing protein 7 [Bombina bombina]
MEFSERKRSRKSQSFKLVNQEYHEIFKASGYSSDVNGESKDLEQLSGDESFEIKKQITGMRRLLNDSTGRIYQRVGKEGEKLKQEPHDKDLGWADSLSAPCEAEEPIHHSQSPWNEVPIQPPEFTGQYGTRSKTVQNNVKNTTGGSNGELRIGNTKCCTCTCQPMLQAILQELRAMRKFMQIQAAAQNRLQVPQSCICSQKSVMTRKRIKKKKVLPKSMLSSNRALNVSVNKQKDTELQEKSSLTQTEQLTKIEEHTQGFGIVHNSSSSDPEIQLAEGFDVFMPKSQLDSILSNYTRSGSLLFRKLVCAFFDDKTLANSLPNGKRKRGLNDNRKGLDQNIVGAIKVFTEKYCTANNVDKAPGPRGWVQILQDQIKLARRRVKRGCDSEFTGFDEKTDAISLPQTGSLFHTTDDDVWLNSKPGF